MSNHESETARDTAGGRATGEKQGIEQFAKRFGFTLVDPDDDVEAVDEGDTEVWVVAREATGRTGLTRPQARERQRGESRTTDDGEAA